LRSQHFVVLLLKVVLFFVAVSWIVSHTDKFSHLGQVRGLQLEWSHV